MSLGEIAFGTKEVENLCRLPQPMTGNETFVNVKIKTLFHHSEQYSSDLIQVQNQEELDVIKRPNNVGDGK